MNEREGNKMSLLFEPSTSLEAHKMLISAKNDINEYFKG